ncbi:MAG: hypothetical protein ACREN7_03520, partial [Candidatus Dormibacteria bacterium]
MTSSPAYLDLERLGRDLDGPQAAQSRTVAVVAGLRWGQAPPGSRSPLGLAARFTLRAAGGAGPGREGARAVHVAAAAELTERALQWHRAAALD